MKRIAAFLAFCLLATPALGAQAILTLGGATLSTTVQQYSSIGANATLSATADDVSYPRAGAAGTLGKLQVYLSTAPGVGASRTFTVKLNNAVTLLTCTISDADWDCDDPSNTVAVAVNDILTATYTLTGAPAAATMSMALLFTPTTAEQQLVMTRATGVSTTVKSFSAIVQGSIAPWNTTESVTTQIVGVAGTFSNMYVGSSLAPGTAGDAYTIAPSLAGVDTALTCQLLNTATTCNNVANSFSAAQDQLISFGSTPAVTPVASNVGIGMRFVPTTAGDFFFTSHATNTASTSATQFLPLSGGRAVSNVEAPAVMVFPAGGPFIVNRMRVVDVDPAGAASRTFTLRKGSGATGVMASTGIACTIAAGATSCTGTGSVSFAQTDLASIQTAPTGTPTSGSPKIALGGTTSAPAAPTNKGLMLLGVGR